MTRYRSTVCAFGLLLVALSCSSADRDGGAAAGGTGGTGGAGGFSGGGGPGRTISPVDWPENEGLGEEQGEPATGGNSLLEIPECTAANPGKNARVVDFVPADANARGSAILAREALDAGRAPVPVHLRTHEILSHYAPRLAPSPGATVALVELRAHPEVAGSYELMVGIEVPPAQARPPIALTLAIDTTRSMQTVFARAASAVSALGAALAPGDEVRWITSDSSAPPVQITIGETEDSALEQLAAGTLADRDEHALALTQLVDRAVEAARSRVVPGAWNRIVVITDGDADLDESTHQAVKGAATQDGILTLAVGVGSAFEHSPRSLRLLSHAGRGPYLHIDDGGAAILSDRFTEMFGVALDDFHVRLTVPWYFQVERPYAFETTSPEQAPAQYLAPGQVAVFPFRLAACSDLALAMSDTIDVNFEWTDASTGATSTLSHSQSLEDLLDPGAPDVVLAHVFAVLGYAEALRALDETRLSRALSAVQTANAMQPSPELGEILTLLGKHPALLP